MFRIMRSQIDNKEKEIKKEVGVMGGKNTIDFNGENKVTTATMNEFVAKSLENCVYFSYLLALLLSIRPPTVRCSA